MKMHILLIGYGISPYRKEAVSINSLLLTQHIKKLGGKVTILNVGYTEGDLSFGTSMSDAVLHSSNIRKKIADYIRKNNVTHIIDVFVLPLASLIFIAPLKPAFPNVSFIKEIHNDYGASRQLHIETAIRLLANNWIFFNQVLNTYDSYFSRNLYLTKKYSFSYLPMIVQRHPVIKRSQKEKIYISYLGHPLKKKGIYEFPKLFALLSDKMKRTCIFSFALSDIGDRSVVEKILIESARTHSVTIKIYHEVKPWKFFRTQDFYVLPIHDQFGAVSTPNTVLEAMEAGAIPVVHDIPSLKGIIDDGKTGVLLEKFDAEYIVDVLKDLVYDRVLQKKLRLSARNFILTSFNERNIQITIRKLLS